MAEITQIFPKDEADRILRVGEALRTTDERLLAMSGNLEKVSLLMKQAGLSGEKMSKAQKQTATTSKELDEVGKKLLNTEKQLKQMEDSRTTQIIKNRQETQKQTREIKLQVAAQNSLKGSYNQISAALSQNLIKYKNMSAAQRDNTKAGKNLQQTIMKQRAELAKLDSRLGNHTRNVGNYRGAIMGAARSLLGAFGLVGGVAMFARVLTNAFSTVRSFTKENAVLAGVLGKTRAEVTQLTDQAVALGSQYPVTASEVTKLQVAYARLGFTQSEIMNLTEATIQGSIALNASLDDTATLVGAVVRSFTDLKTQDSTKIIDTLTKVTQRSSLSFESLEQAVPKVAAAANAMNIELEEMSAQLGIAHDATLDASIAGTSLRNIYLELSKRGLSMDEALNQIQGSTNQLRASFELFGKRGAIVGLALANNRDRAKELEEELRNSGGTAKRVAEEQMATLDGALKGLASSWEKFVLGLKESEGILSNTATALAEILDNATDKGASFWEKLASFGNVNAALMQKSMREAKEGVIQSITEMDQEALEELISNNQALADEGEKFAQQMIDAARRRLDNIAQEEKDAATREKQAQQEKELQRIIAEEEANKKLLDQRTKWALDMATAANKATGDSQEDADFRARFEAELDWELKQEQAKLDNEVKANIEAFREIERQNEEFRKRDLEAEKEAAALKAEIRQAQFDLVVEGINALFEIRQNKYNSELEALEAQKEKELSAENMSREQKAAIEKKYAEKEKKLKIKQAKADKTQAMFNIALNTAQAVMKTFAQFGWPIGIPLAALMAATGAVQLAVAASQPIPQFAKGTKSAPSKFIAGEAGREIVELPTGESMLASRATLFEGNKFKGATVHTNKETERILSQAERRESFVFDTSDLRDEMRDIKRAIENKPVLIFDKNNRSIGYQTSNYRKTYLNRLRYE